MAKTILKELHELISKEFPKMKAYIGMQGYTVSKPIISVTTKLYKDAVRLTQYRTKDGLAMSMCDSEIIKVVIFPRSITVYVGAAATRLRYGEFIPRTDKHLAQAKVLGLQSITMFSSGLHTSQRFDNGSWYDQHETAAYPYVLQHGKAKDMKSIRDFIVKHNLVSEVITHD